MSTMNIKSNSIIFLFVIFSIIVATFLWDKISLPLDNELGIISPLTIDGYNPINDTIRYILFIALPLFTFLLLNISINKEKLSLKGILFEKYDDSQIHNCNFFIFPTIILIFFIIFEFASLNLFNYRLDPFHDGDYLTPAYNYISTNKFWLSSFTIHGGSDFFYPLMMWKIFDVNTIGAGRFSFIILILILKFLLIILSYQLSKNLYLTKESKLILFTILATSLISMCSYNVPLNYSYFSYRDIYIILFLIFFIELFINNKLNTLITIFISLISTTAIFFHFDIGVYINFILLCYVIYLLIIKKYKEIIIIFSSLIIFWCLAIYFIGFNEFEAFLDNAKSIILSIDLMHGLKHPIPFLSINEIEYGTRATRGLLLQITAGIFVIYYLFSNKKKISSSKKVFFIFLFLISFIMYKNALGRSDTNHLRMSADFPILINLFFILNYLLIYLEKFFLGKYKFSSILISFVIVLYMSFFFLVNQSKYNLYNAINFKTNFLKYINLDDYEFIDQDKRKLIDFYKKIAANDNCVQIFTFDLAFPYLLKKPSCTRYFSSWLTSPIKKQQIYIDDLKNINAQYILYKSKGKNFDYTFSVEPPKLSERLDLVNSYILSNYNNFKEFDGYVILKKNN